MSISALAHETVWLNKSIYDKAECLYHENLSKIENITCLIKNNDSVPSKVISEKGTQDITNIAQDVEKILKNLDVDGRSKELDGSQTSLNVQNSLKKFSSCKDDSEDIDLFDFDSEDENEEVTKIREERLAAYAAKKSKKPTLIAKSNIIFDVKPWDDETDMQAMEDAVRKIMKDGLLWGAAKLVPVAFKIKKLQISCVVEDDKISVDWLTDQIQEIEDLVQSIDIAAFNKV